MKAMVLSRSGVPLELQEIPEPRPGPRDVLLEVHSCGVCRTDLHILDGELADPALPLVPGHQIVGTILETGSEVTLRRKGERVGVPWLGWTCGICEWCTSGRENLCPRARFTGYHRDGGFAEMCAADERYCFPVPAGYPDLQAGPLLCAGLIGYRALRLAGDGRTLGFFGFGSAAHILLQVALSQGRTVFAFTRPGDDDSQQFARKLGAAWAGDTTAPPSGSLDAALIFAPAGELVPLALRFTRPGGTVVCAGIHMSPIPSFPYSDLWQERVLRSVANLTREDGIEFLALAPTIPIATEVRTFSLEEANEALTVLRRGELRGSAVLSIR